MYNKALGFILFGACMAHMVSQAAADEMYKCIDANGRVSYYQKKPVEGCANSKTIKVDGGGTSSANQTSQSNSQNKPSSQNKRAASDTTSVQVDLEGSGQSLHFDVPNAPASR